ncbi:MAG: hypothetical protein O7G30_03400 [Proteobacteria bacterium]|nr:hypothetical protein [Pseudomonadota bacterium]
MGAMVASTGRILLALAVLMTLPGCVPSRHQLDPYSEEGPEARQIEAEARLRCVARRGAEHTPEAAFVTDACSMWPNSVWVDCCVHHDMDYWCGGSAEDRKRSDRALRACVSDAGRPRTSALMYWGVRAGGPPWMPMSHRWGYGWPWPRGYDD